MTLEQVDLVMSEMQSLEPGQRGVLLAIDALLGVDPQVLLASRRPSPGKARNLEHFDLP